MSTNNRTRKKGRRASGTFALIPSEIVDSPAYASLSWPARALLLEMASMYRGSDEKHRKGNNGDLSAAYALHKARGWHRSTLQNTCAELEKSGFIVRTRQGGRNACNLYALTWRPIDECGGKLDAGVRTGGAPLRLWTSNRNILPSPQKGQGRAPLARVPGHPNPKPARSSPNIGLVAPNLADGLARETGTF